MSATKLSEFRGTGELLSNLVLRELRGRYKRSVLGWAWSLINPLATVMIYWLVFSIFLKVEPPRGDPSGLKSFVLFLVCGLLPYRFLSESISASVDSLLQNANLVKKVYFPRELVVLSAVGSLLVTFLIELGVLLVLLLFFGNMVLPWIPLVLVIVVLQSALLLGVSLILAPLNVYLRDVKHFVGIALQLLFYSAPIVYPLRLVPKRPDVLGMEIPFRTIYQLNPLVVIVECFRDVMYDLRFPEIRDLGYLAAWAIGMLLFGRWVFGRLDRRLAEEV
jgi:ABC-type polysaccharide/polyol phosphate export permease